jgi:tetratricopeptide (TPR) repeat protein
MLSTVSVLAWALLAAGPNPRAAELLGRAHAAMAFKDYELALPLWRELTTLEPQDARARVELGRCLLRLDKPHEALRALEEAVALEPAVKEGAALLAEARRNASVTPETPVPSAAPGSRAKNERIGEAALSLGEISRRASKKTGTGRTYQLSEGSGSRSEPDVNPELAAEEAAAPRTLLDSMRQQAESILRPRMTSAAPAIRELEQIWQQYMDACYRKTTTHYTRADGSSGTVVKTWSGQEPGSYGSEAQWDRYWTSATTHRNEDTPECLGLAGRINGLADSLRAVMNGADHELAMPPSVYPGVREEVFDRLADELW